MLNKTYIKTFAICVMRGTYSLDPEDGKKLVPERYREAVAEYIADYLTAHEG